MNGFAESNYSFSHLFARLFFAVFILITPFFSADSYSLNVNQVNLEDSLNHALVHDIFKSSNGTLWVAYRDAIVRRRGDDSDIYRLNVPKFPVAFPVYINIVQYQDRIWISYENTLHLFNREKNEFEQVEIKGVDDSGVADMFIDSQGVFWLATFTAVYKKTAPGHDFNQVAFPDGFAPIYKGEPLQLFATRFVEDNSGTLWLGSEYLGLIRVPRSKQESYQRYDIDSDTAVLLNANSIFTVYPIDEKHLLLGTTKGLYVFNKSTQYRAKITTGLKLSTVLNIIAIDEQTLWINADGRLLRLVIGGDFDQTMPALSFSPIALTTKPELMVKDDEGVIWLGGRSGGLLSTSLYANAVEVFQPDITGVNVVAATPQGWLFGGDEGSFLPGNEGYGDLPVYGYFGDEKRQYIGSQDRLVKWPGGQQFEAKFAEGSAGKITSIAGSGKYLALVTSRFGLIVYNTQTGIFHQQIAVDKTGFELQQAIKVFASSMPDKVLVAFPNGMAVFDMRQMHINESAVSADKADYEVYRASAFDRHYYLFDQHNQVRVFDKQGVLRRQIDLPVANIGCMASFKSGEWWLASAYGPLYRWRRDSGQLHLLTAQDGLLKGGVNGKECRLHEGRLFFSGHNAVYQVGQHSQVFNAHQPKVSMEVHYRQKDRVNVLNDDTTGTFELFDDGFPLVVKVFGSSFVSPQENQLRLRIPQLSPNWDVRSQNNNAFVFNALPKGPLTIEVAAGNNDGVWSQAKSLEMYVHPPWYLSWVAIAAYLLTTILLFFWFYRYRLNAANARNRALEAAVNQRTLELAEQKQHVETLLASKEAEFVHLSHELRTPLTLILGPVKSLAGEEKSLFKKHKMQMVLRNGQRLLRMVDQLLHLEKFRMQQVEHRVTQDIALTMRLVVESFHQVAANKGVNLSVGEVAEINGRFIADALDKILLNLVSNGIKYTPSGGDVVITSTLQNNGDLSIKVSDSGIGIEQQQLGNIFDRYYRVTDGNSEKVTGAGVGLTLVKQLLDCHQAQIKVYSTFGKGSTFEVILPAELLTDDKPGDEKTNTELLEIELGELAGAQASEADTPETTDNDGKPLLLVVEDNQDMRHYIKQTLSGHYTVQLAVDGEQGLEKAKMLIPDLVISDVMMPKLNGYELCQALKSDPLVCHVPVIMLTARGDRQSRMEGWQKAADEYLTKPFDEEELIIRVSNLLSIRKLLRNRYGREIEQGNCVDLSDQNEAVNPHDKAFIEKMDLIVRDNYQQIEFTAIKFADLIAMSERQLQRKMKALINTTPKEYIRNYRLNQAKKLLSQGMKVNLVADDCGFSSPSYFASCFKAKFAMTASQFQQSLM